MLVCTKCNHTQESGQFCANCGGQLAQQASAEEAAATQQATIQPNEQQAQQPNPTVENVKKELSNYWDFILTYIKTPTNGLNATGSTFAFGIITLVLYAITFSLSTYFLINSAVRELSSFFGASQSAPFFEIFFKTLLVMAVLLLVGIVSAFIMIKVAKANVSFQDIIAQVGSLSTPYLLVNLLAIVTALANFQGFTTTLLIIGFLLIGIFTPALLVFEKATQIDAQGQRYYYTIGTVVLAFVFNYIVLNFILDSMVRDIPVFGFF